jgi:hypothetical protein
MCKRKKSSSFDDENRVEKIHFLLLQSRKEAFSFTYFSIDFEGIEKPQKRKMLKNAMTFAFVFLALICIVAGARPNKEATREHKASGARIPVMKLPPMPAKLRAQLQQPLTPEQHIVLLKQAENVTEGETDNGFDTCDSCHYRKFSEPLPELIGKQTTIPPKNRLVLFLLNQQWLRE